MIADSEHDADMLYVAGMFVPDAFIAVELDGAWHGLFSPLEVDRAKKQSAFRQVHLDSPWREQAAAQNRSGLPGVAAAFLDAHGVRRLRVPGHFPLAYAEQLRAWGFEVVAVEASMFPERAVKSEFEIRALAQAERLTRQSMQQAERFLAACSVGDDGILHPISPTPHPGGWIRLDADDTRAVFCDVEPGGGRELVVAVEDGRLLVLDPRDGFAEIASRELPHDDYIEAGGELWPACGDVDGDGLEELLVGLDGPGDGYYALFDGDDGPSGPPAEGAPGWERLPHAIYNQVDGATRPAVSRELVLPADDADDANAEDGGGASQGDDDADGGGGSQPEDAEAGEDGASEDVGGDGASDGGNADEGADGNGDETDGGSVADGGSGADEAASLAAFTETVHPITLARCAACHAGFGPGSPALAAADPTTAFRAVVDNQKVDLVEPERSRLVRRLSIDRHFCWSDCDADAETMRLAIATWADRIGASQAATALPADALATPELALADGMETERSGRSDDAVIAVWTFEEGSGAVAHDSSGVDPAIDLALQGVQWLPGGGIEIVDGKAQAGPETARKLYDRIANPLSGTNEYSIEAWVTPANTDQEGPARIVSYSRDTGQRNFTMGQVRYNYVFRNRSRAPGISRNGTPGLYTADGDQDLQATLQHVVMTFDQEHGRRIYVNGRFTDDVDRKGPGALDTWDPRYSFILGNERTDNRLWKGKIRFVAIHERALEPEEISRNFLAGAGKTTVLRFDISRWTGLAGSAIEVEASEFDASSYLFARPTYVGPPAAGLRIRNIRIAVNGEVPVAGQAFRNLDAVVTGARQELSPLASVIAADRGAEEDRFALLFEVLGDRRAALAENDAPVVPGGFSEEPRPRIGMRTFRQIHQTMAALTGVSPRSREVREVFEEIRDQLPSSPDVRTFVSSHQVSVFKLALEYCDVLVETPRLRDAFFGGNPPLPLASPVAQVFGDPVLRQRVLDTTVDRFFGTDLEDQPARDRVRPILDGLVDILVGSCAGDEAPEDEDCGAERTRVVLKSVCSAVLGSAPVLLY